jgi:hypothetical protein
LRKRRRSHAFGNISNLDDEDLRALERQIMENPLAGKVMRNSGGVRKIRFAPPSRGSGKSGGYRVCYFYFPMQEIVYFVLVFPKSEQPNLTPEQLKLAARWLKRSSALWFKSGCYKGSDYAKSIERNPRRSVGSESH